MRRDERRGLYMPACPNCKYHSEPMVAEIPAIAAWNLANESQRHCLGCGGKPRLRYTKQLDMWSMRCKGCGWHTGLLHTVQGAITAWHCANLPGDQLVLALWKSRRNELRQAG